MGNVVHGNSRGGGAYCKDQVVFRNNTVVGNLAQNQAGGVYVRDWVAVSSNVIAFAASLEEFYVEPGSTLVTARYNCIFSPDGQFFGGDAESIVNNGQGNLLLDPLLEDDGFHLSPASPCANAGDPVFVPVEDETDVDGEPRVIDGRVEIGADEIAFDCPGDLDCDDITDKDDNCPLIYNPDQTDSDGDGQGMPATRMTTTTACLIWQTTAR